MRTTIITCDACRETVKDGEAFSLTIENFFVELCRACAGCANLHDLKADLQKGVDDATSKR